MAYRETRIFEWPTDGSQWRERRLSVDDHASVASREDRDLKERGGVLNGLAWRAYDDVIEFARIPSRRWDAYGQSVVALRLGLPAPLVGEPCRDTPVEQEEGPHRGIVVYVATEDGRLYRLRVMLAMEGDALMDVDAMVVVEAMADLKLRISCIGWLRSGRVVAGFDNGDVGLVLFQGSSVRLRRFVLPVEEDHGRGRGQQKTSRSLSRILGLGGGVESSDREDLTVEAVSVATAGPAGREDDFVCVLERRGRIRVWRSIWVDQSDPKFTCVFEQELGIRLARNYDHFVVPAKAPTLSCHFIFIMDEEERAPSLRGFSLTLYEGSAVAIREFLSLDGPVDNISGISTIQRDPGMSLCIAYSSGDLRVVDLVGDSPRTTARADCVPHTVWSCCDEHDDDRGLWKVVDAQQRLSESRLFAPYRFSDAVISRAIRRPDLEYLTRSDLITRTAAFLQSLISGTSQQTLEEAMDRLVDRASRLVRSYDLPLLGIHSDTDGVVFATRKGSISVLRRCNRMEAFVLFGHDDGLDEDDISVMTEMSTSMCVLQSLSTAVYATRDQERAFDALRATLSFGCRLSQHEPKSYLLTLAVRRVLSNPLMTNRTPGDWIREVSAVLAPGPQLLVFLRSAKETSALLEASRSLEPILPASTSFAFGLCQLEAWALDRDRKEEDASHIVNDYMMCIEMKDLADNPEDSFTLGELALVPGDQSSWTPEYLMFWYRERLVRLLEAARAPLTAANVAVGALPWSLDREGFEMMRNAAFHRFLEASELERALKVVLEDPFAEDETSMAQEEEKAAASALKDAISLLVSAAAERNMMSWLAGAELPPPVTSLMAWALRRRARASNVSRKSTKVSSPYEDLCSWHMVRGDLASVASAAIEWSRRLLLEEAVFKVSPLAWLKDREHALTWATSAIHCLAPSRNRWVPTADLFLDDGLLATSELDKVLESVSSQEFVEELSQVDMSSLTLDAGELERLLVLVQAQCHVVEHLLDEGRPLASLGNLDESELAVDWCLAGLCEQKAYEDATTLALVWSSKLSISRLLEPIFQSVTREAVTTSQWVEVRRLVDRLDAHRRDHPHASLPANYWFKIAEIALAASGGTQMLPSWILNLCAWGLDGRAPNFAASNGDAGATANLLLKYGRDLEAADLLSTGLMALDPEGKEEVRIPYLQIDALIHKLSSANTQSSRYRLNHLIALTKNHISGFRVDRNAME